MLETIGGMTATAVILSGVGYYKLIRPVRKLKAQLSSDQKIIVSDGVKSLWLKDIIQEVERLQKANEAYEERLSLEKVNREEKLAELNQVTTESQDLIAEIHNMMEDTEKGALLQSQNVSKSTQVMSEMSSGVQEIAQNIQEASVLVNETSIIVSKGQKAVNVAVDGMTSIDVKIKTLSEIIYDLGSRSKEIHNIVDVITSIAQQTNLLALNANIEAARAGEAGRGFAVVADEVRKLAEQSSESAKQISLLISTIQGKTDEAVEAMDSSMHDVEVGKGAVQEAGTSFNQVSESISSVNNQIEELAVNAEQMASGTDEIIKLIKFTKKVQDGGVSKIQEATKTIKGEIELLQRIHENVVG